jgi:hypothetical protein
MKTLYKTLAVVTLAAGSLGLTQAAQAGDRLTIIYSDSDYIASPGLYRHHWPAAPLYYHYGDRHGYSRHYPWRAVKKHKHNYRKHRGHDRRHGHHDRDSHRRHDDRWTRHQHRDYRRDDRHGYDGRHHSRVGHSAYVEGKRD